MQPKPLHVRTPVFESTILSAQLGKPVFLKMECYQPVGSFKIRGIGQLCQEWVASGKRHLVSSSGGNAGYSVAYAGKRLGVQVTVFVPTNTASVYIDHIRAEGAEVKIEGDIWDEANKAAQKYVKKVEGGFVPPFDHPTIWAGHSTLVDELVEQCEKPGAIVVSVGGGGLSCGILQGLYRHGWPDVPIFAVETEGAASFYAAMQAGKLVTLPGIHTVATTLGVVRVCTELFNWAQKHPITPLVVSDKAAVLACRRFVDDHRVLVEPACGAALSVIYDRAPSLTTAHSLLVIVCGGIGISLALLEKYLQQCGQSNS
ncbi:MAG: serine dehydratase [Coxiella sp. RIFCSPHIGHO2_12_FULL_44_14]|nr:MAG: serine dehydratase [Coxiella sp. RIFCSPHIGHO2_12_FULL_44_14]